MAGPVRSHSKEAIALGLVGERFDAQVGRGGQIGHKVVVDVLGELATEQGWNELIERYHYLGYQTLPGARYFVVRQTPRLVLGAIGLSAAAWRLAPRDRFIGWTDDQRQRRLHLVVNQSRYLILPWISVRTLASSVLALMARVVVRDWQALYGYSPVLLETFVDGRRFKGTCYRAANWLHLGQTQGRGKLDRHYRRPLPVKEIFVYPLRRDFRTALRGDPSD